MAVFENGAARAAEATRAWCESDEGTTWNGTTCEVWDSEGAELEFWLEQSEVGSTRIT